MQKLNSETFYEDMKAAVKSIYEKDPSKDVEVYGVVILEPVYYEALAAGGNVLIMYAWCEAEKDFEEAFAFVRTSLAELNYWHSGKTKFPWWTSFKRDGDYWMPKQRILDCYTLSKDEYDAIVTPPWKKEKKD